MKYVVIILAILAVNQPSGATGLEIDSSKSHYGCLQISWKEIPIDGNGYFLYMDTLANFSTPRLAMQGMDKTTFISGLKSGKYFFKLTGAGEPQTVLAESSAIVRHDSISFAFKLFFLGAVVAGLTFIVVLSGKLQWRC